MHELQRSTRVPDQVAELDIRFRFELVKSAKYNSVKEYECLVESNVWCSDGIITSNRASHSLIILRALKKPVFFWQEKHCLDSLLHKHRQIRLYKIFDTDMAQTECKKLNDYVALLVAPTQRVWIQSHNLAARMMKEASAFLVVNHVMEI